MESESEYIVFLKRVKLAAEAQIWYFDAVFVVAAAVAGFPALH